MGEKERDWGEERGQSLYFGRDNWIACLLPGKTNQTQSVWKDVNSAEGVFL